jgi:hypothetical protein
MNYNDFIKLKGRRVSETYQGNKEVALSTKDALQALELLKDAQVEILGGDIFSEDNDELIYANQLWGAEYHYLNWYSEKEKDESNEAYLIRNYNEAKDGICNASLVAQKLQKTCYIAFVL